jgi:TonB family protein
MKINKTYLEASFISFVFHGLIIIYLLGFFYFEIRDKSVLSKPVDVNLIFKEEPKPVNKSMPDTNQKIQETPQINATNVENITTKSISFDSLIKSTNVEELIKEDNLFLIESEENQVNLYSSLIIENIQSAWRKPINVQDGLVCNLRLSINKNGRVINVNLIKSSGNIRFDNSALKAVQRVETFDFFKKIPFNIYSSNFKNIVITFNPS